MDLLCRAWIRTDHRLLHALVRASTVHQTLATTYQRQCHSRASRYAASRARRPHYDSSTARCPRRFLQHLGVSLKRLEEFGTNDNRLVAPKVVDEGLRAGDHAINGVVDPLHFVSEVVDPAGDDWYGKVSIAS